MKKPILQALLILFISSCADREPIQINKSPERGFTSNRPAKIWQEALVTGNGKMGAMITGHPLAQLYTRIIFSTKNKQQMGQNKWRN